MNEKHALVIGGTGMLAKVTLWLADNHANVSVIGRTQKKHRDLIEKASDPAQLNNIAVDYYDLGALETKLKQAMDRYGPITVAVCWSPFYPAVERICQVISERTDNWQLYHVKGSRRYFEDEPLSVPASCQYRSIYLGFVLTGNLSRWLTHDEIAGGIIEGVKKDEARVVVGTIHPYENRPR
ncbi:short-chain dehydrogenase [Sediminibacillus dalangtanensis]|uniref:Short-chain dehydrogenase n=1 Tax=Sediminibacillus dalangtanensis TaxID=2729421 RepID=A0ABX7VTK3_9BACI|nr:short-chain dehydrogenase [Sediminibacillus dalangtanensis]QTM98803.1 short-chain dehydrogenase [Sediminibacillus dalangtanensis]